jgi:Ser-tRNA(Ala) deacylase AlaX
LPLTQKKIEEMAAHVDAATEQVRETTEATERVYLKDTYLFELQTALVSIESVEGNKHGSHKVVLRATIFHPQGGGQPADVGQLFTVDSDGKETAFFNVAFAQSQGSIVEHYGNVLEGAAVPECNAEIIARINADSRVLHARLHSAGHAIDAVMNQLGFGEQLKPTKGYHFRDAPYVEYDASKCSLTDKELDELVIRVNEGLQNLIAHSIPTTVAVMSKPEAEAHCQSDLTGYPEVVRVVEIGNAACPCGGTHINSTSELGKLVIQKMKKKKNILKVTYCLE